MILLVLCIYRDNHFRGNSFGLDKEKTEEPQENKDE